MTVPKTIFGTPVLWPNNHRNVVVGIETMPFQWWYHNCGIPFSGRLGYITIARWMVKTPCFRNVFGPLETCFYSLTSSLSCYSWLVALVAAWNGMLLFYCPCFKKMVLSAALLFFMYCAAVYPTFYWLITNRSNPVGKTVECWIVLKSWISGKRLLNSSVGIVSNLCYYIFVENV